MCEDFASGNMTSMLEEVIETRLSKDDCFQEHILESKKMIELEKEAERESDRLSTCKKTMAACVEFGLSSFQNEYQSEISIDSSKVDSLRNSITSLMSTNSSLKARIRTLNREKEELKSANKTLTSKISNKRFNLNKSPKQQDVNNVEVVSKLPLEQVLKLSIYRNLTGSFPFGGVVSTTD